MGKSKLPVVLCLSMSALLERHHQHAGPAAGLSKKLSDSFWYPTYPNFVFHLSVFWTLGDLKALLEVLEKHRLCTLVDLHVVLWESELGAQDHRGGVGNLENDWRANETKPKPINPKCLEICLQSCSQKNRLLDSNRNIFNRNTKSPRVPPVDKSGNLQTPRHRKSLLPILWPPRSGAPEAQRWAM